MNLIRAMTVEYGEPITKETHWLNQEYKDKLGLIQQSIDRISRTVRTLVDFSRPVAEKVENIYLNNVIEHVIRIIKYDKRLKHQRVETDLEPGIGVTRASFDQILQVFINICLNAADAMEGKTKARDDTSITTRKSRLNRIGSPFGFVNEVRMLRVFFFNTCRIICQMFEKNITIRSQSSNRSL